MDPKAIAQDLWQVYKEWEMMDREKDTDLLIMKPAMARLTGSYPADFEMEVE